ncbi:MAG: YidB family protein [Granulosicoccus sp.]
MDLLKMGKDLLGDKFGDDAGGIMDALSGLTGGDGGLDIGGLAEKFKAGGMGDQVKSWLGDGDNEAVSGEQIKSVFGADKIGEVASKMGVDADSAADQLSQAVPTLLDKASSGGSLLSSLMSGGNPLDMAKNLLNK